MSKGSTRPRSIGISSKPGPHELLFQRRVTGGSLCLSLELHAADAEAAVADDDDHLLARARELDADAHADAVTDGRERPRVHDLPGEARAEPLREPAREREAVDHERRIAVHQLEQIARHARGMDRHVLVHFGLLRAERLVELGAHARDLGQPGAALARDPAPGGEVAELPE